MKVTAFAWIDCDKLRNYCIQRNLYTRGDCEAYENMFKMAGKYDGDINVLINVAENIVEHSDVETLADMSMTNDKKGWIECVMNGIEYYAVERNYSVEELSE